MDAALKPSQVQSAPFTLAGALAGARAAALLVPTIIVFGITFGMVSATAGLSVMEAAVMSAVVCAGTAQYAALQIWSDPVSWFAVGVTSLAMNSRYILLGATLRDWFGQLSAAKAYASLWFLYDGNWATAMRDRAEGRMDAAHLLGAGILMCTVWTVATAAGHAFGGFLGDPKRLGLDFVITAFFASLAIDFWRGRGDVMPMAAAIAVAVAVETWTPGPWYILAGAITGCLTAMVRYQPPAKGAANAA